MLNTKKNNWPKQCVRLGAAVAVWCWVGTAFAISFGKPGGDWPKSWPQQLEPFRKQAWTWEHGFGGMSYDIPFANREEFEAAWPHIVSLKSKGATLTLRKGSHLRISKPKAPLTRNAGVIIYLPREGATTGITTMTRIDLIVDGTIVDLNRIEFPKDTLIRDNRFPKPQVKSNDKSDKTKKRPNAPKKRPARPAAAAPATTRQALPKPSVSE